MGMSLATKVLGRLVPEEVFSAQKSVEAFWMISSSASESSVDKVNVTHMKGTCLSENKESEENHGNAHNFSSSFVDRVEESHMKLAICHERESIEEAKKIGCSDIVEFNVMGGGDIENEEEEAGEEDKGNGDDDQENVMGGGEIENDDEEEVEGEEKGEEQEQEQEKAKKSGQILKRKRYSFRNNCAKKLTDEHTKNKQQEVLSLTRSLTQESNKRFKDYCENKRDVAQMIPQLNMEDEIKQFKRKLEGNASKKREFNQTNSIPSRLPYTRRLGQHFLSSWIGAKENRHKPLTYPSDIEREYDLYKEWMKKTRPEMEVGAMLVGAIEDASLMKLTDKHTKSKQQEVVSLMAPGEEASKLGMNQTTAQPEAYPKATTAAEEKAAKRQRLKSGFRICKPQGTFLRPNSNNSTSGKLLSPQMVFQVEVPTPPPVSYSTAAAPPQLPYPQPHEHHHHHIPASLVKPLAEKCTVTISTVSDFQNNESSAAALINLVNAPTNVMPLAHLSPTANTEPWQNTSYGSRHATDNDPKECNTSASQQQVVSSEVGEWLLLPSSKSASDESNQG